VASVDGVVADLIILAIDTLKIAVGKKNIAYTLGTAYGWFFSGMNADGSNVERVVSFTKPFSFIMPVYMTIMWAIGTIIEMFHRMFF